MKKIKQWLSRLMLVGCMGLVLPLLGFAKPEITVEPSVDKTLSPYFFVKSDNPRVDRLPLKSTRADVTISGVIADVTVTQVYKNEGKNTLEAIYVFPASSRAAVYAMRMTVGKRTIEAKIQERQQARETYEKALAEGKTASLLEQQRPNVFQMNVGNILPGDDIKVVLNYTELLVPEDATYEFVYPTVVGPRYSNQKESTAGTQDKWVANPYLKEGKDAPFTFGFGLTLNSGMPIARLTSPSHDVDIEYMGKNAASIGLKESNKTNNRDVVVRYSLAGDQIESGLLMNLGKKEDFFLLMLEPPKRVKTNMIVPREYIFVIDVSGSMGGFPLDVTKTLMKDLFKNLRSTDFFNIMLFSGGNKVLSEKSLPATQANLKKAFDVIDNQRGGGGTQLMPALRAAMALPRAEDNISRSMIIVTDGYVSIEKDAFDTISKNLNKGNVFSFGIGSSVNRLLIEGLARAGMGEPFIILNHEEAKVKAKKFKAYIESPVLTDIKVTFAGMQVSDVEPQSVPDLFAKKPVVVFGKYKKTPKGTITITGKTAGKPYKKVIRVSEGEISTENKALRYLWARHRIVRLADMVKMQYDDKRIKEVTQLGLEYNLLTDYTSFVAVDTEVRTDGKPKDTVKQPLPLPQGVSDSAVGGMAFATKSAQVPGRMTRKPRGKRMLYKKNVMGAAQAPPAPLVEESVSEMEPKAEDDASLVNTLTVLSVKGALDKTKVEKAIIKQKPSIFKALDRAGLAGLVTLELTVDKNGKISKITVARETFGDKKLVAILERLLKRVRFSTTQDGKAASIQVMIQATP